LGARVDGTDDVARPVVADVQQAFRRHVAVRGDGVEGERVGFGVADAAGREVVRHPGREAGS
jgi:hypothetical protein